ncbi:MAG: insulinase family protein [Bacteroidota bacterium]
MKKTSLILVLLVSFIYSSFSQTNFNLNDNIPVDEAVKIGKLDNGLTYYIRNNPKPEKRAEFFLVVNAGSILEDDDQDGLAHFCEHMAFNGTKNFEKHNIIDFLQSIGMKFGPEINAFTNHDVTNYMLQKVPTDVPENVDKALLVLFDWASNVSYEDEEIDNERGVIHEEWRVRRGADFRMGMETDKIIFEGSKYAKRDVIGNIDIIDKAPYEAFKRFYKDWYRPDLQAIIAIGDFEVNEMEQKIKTQFSKIPKREQEKERGDFEIPDHDGCRIAIAKDAEATYSRVSVSYKHDIVTEKTKQSYLRDGLISRLFTVLLNNRLKEYTQSPDAPFSYGYAYYGNLRRTKDNFGTSVFARNNEVENSIKLVLEEHKRLQQFGFTENEFENAKKEVLKQYEKAVKEKDKNLSSSYTWTYYSHFLSQNPIPSIQFSYDFAMKFIPEIKLVEVNKLAQEWITKDNQIITITGPDNTEIKIPTKEIVQEIILKVEKAEIKPYSDVILTKPLISTEPTGSVVEKQSYNEELGMHELYLKNGAKVLIKKTDFKEDEILFRFYSPGGSNLYNDTEYLNVTNCTGIADKSGLGNYNSVELSKFLSGKFIRYNLWVGNLYDEISGSTRPQDFETAMQMIYAQFTSPVFTEEGFNVYLDQQKTWLENQKLDPEQALWDSISLITYDYNKRFEPLTIEKLKTVDYKQADIFYKQRFSDASNFTFLFVGNIDVEKFKTVIEKYIGGIPSENKAENWKDIGIRPHDGVITKTIVKEMKVPKTTFYLSYNNEYKYSLENDVKFMAIQDILDVRYTETIREEQGGTYGVSVYGDLYKFPYENLSMDIMFDTDPEKVDKLKAIIYDEINKLKASGPEQKYLDNFKKNKLKEIEEKMIQNNFWLSQIRYKDLYGFSILGEDYKTIINNLTVEDIKKAANDMLIDGKRCEFILNPKK